MNKYQSYKPSGVEWIGNIPEEWNCVGTNKVYQDLGTGTTPTSDNEEYYSEDGHHWVTTTDLNEGIMYDTLTKISDKSIEDYPNLKLYPSGSIYISMYGGRIGKLGVSTFESYCNQSVCVLPKNDKISVKFYYYWFLGFQDIVKNMGRGGGQPNINKEMIKQFPTVKLPLQEQLQIVQFLDEKTELIDRLISTKERKITLLKEQRTSLINEVVTKGLNPNVKMKVSGIDWIGEIPEFWVTKKMKYLVQICNGSDFKDFTLEEGGFPVYGSGGEFSRSSKFIYDKISVLLGRKGSVDKPKIVNEPFWCSDTTYYTKIKVEVNPYFFFFLVQQIDFRRFIYGSTIPSMTKSVYDEMEFPYPSINEQNEIVEFLDSKIKEIDDLVQLEQKKIDLLKEYRQSLISEVVTGKIKVTQ
jgi:type I restriction enzyme S subunit